MSTINIEWLTDKKVCLACHTVSEANGAKIFIDGLERMHYIPYAACNCPEDKYKYNHVEESVVYRKVISLLGCGIEDAYL